MTVDLIFIPKISLDKSSLEKYIGICIPMAPLINIYPHGKTQYGKAFFSQVWSPYYDAHQVKWIGIHKIFERIPQLAGVHDIIDAHVLLANACWCAVPARLISCSIGVNITYY